MDEHRSVVLCFQEAHLDTSHNNELRRYDLFRKDCATASHASGGVAIVVQRSGSCIEVLIDTTLEAMTVQILLDRTVTV